MSSFRWLSGKPWSFAANVVYVIVMLGIFAAAWFWLVDGIGYVATLMIVIVVGLMLRISIDVFVKRIYISMKNKNEGG